MFTILFILYNLRKTNKVYWLNLDNGEGVNTGLMILMVDVFLYIIIYGIQ